MQILLHCQDNAAGYILVSPFYRGETQGHKCAVTCLGHFDKVAGKKVKVLVGSDSATPWTVALQGPLSMGFSRQEHWSGLPLPSLGDLPDPGIEPGSPALQGDSLSSEPQRNCCLLFVLYRLRYPGSQLGPPKAP